MDGGLALAASAVEHTAEGVVVTDADWRIVAVNPAFAAITGYPAAEAIGRVSAAFWPDPERGGAPERLADALRERGYWRGEIRCRRKSGESYPAWVSISEIRDGGKPTHYVCMLSDITSQEDAKRQLLRLAYCDSLTALPNRASALERIGRALIASRRDEQLLGVLYLDVDRFKEVNDTLGHAVGDRLLRFVAEALRESVRQTDTVARLGGDEFAVLVPDLKCASSVGQIATAILRRFAQTPFRADGRDIYVGVSIGIAMYPSDAEDCEGLLACADDAMYAAKAAGRGAFRFYAAATGTGCGEGSDLQAELRHALGRDELRLLYQPRMCLRTSRIVGCEVSLGWQRTGYGMVEPELLLPLTQKTELIVPFEHWALRTLAAEIAQWPGTISRDLRFAVGVSAVHLRAVHAEGLLCGLEEIGEAFGHRLELDLRELDLTDCPDRTLDILERIADMGFPLALDRFGAGPVSLRSLKRLPLRCLKLDPLLIRDVDRDREAASVVAAIIDLAHSFGLTVLADGVETSGQIGFLQAHGCDEAQGIFRSPPVAADAFVALLAQSEASRGGIPVSGGSPRRASRDRPRSLPVTPPMSAPPTAPWSPSAAPTCGKQPAASARSSKALRQAHPVSAWET